MILDRMGELHDVASGASEEVLAQSLPCGFFTGRCRWRRPTGLFVERKAVQVEGGTQQVAVHASRVEHAPIGSKSYDHGCQKRPPCPDRPHGEQKAPHEEAGCTVELLPGLGQRLLGFLWFGLWTNGLSAASQKCAFGNEKTAFLSTNGQN